jgi:tetratricopeptide (TPR) repeat protein
MRIAALGTTPLDLSELLAGDLQITIQLPGYESVLVSHEVAADKTVTFAANLIKTSYKGAMVSARSYMAAGDYDRAFQAAGDALIAVPGDADAIAVRNEAAGKQHLRKGKSLAKSGDFIGADKEVGLALQSLPENEEAKQLMADCKEHEPEQIERIRLERAERGQKTFDSIMAGMADAALFESHEIKTTMPAKRALNAILEALKVQPEFHIKKKGLRTSETFEIEAAQELTTTVGTRAGRRQCVLVVAQAADDETQILFKVLEFKAHHSVSDRGLLNFTDNLTYIPVHPSRIPEFTDKLKAQVEEGTKIVTDRIQNAIGGDSEKK